MKKIVITVFSVVLLLFGLIVANSFIGNPVSKMIANKAVKEHIAQNYSGLNLSVTKVKYNFKFNQYFAHAQSPVSPDTNFAVYYGKGKVTDNYEDYVLGDFNTWVRLEEDFNNAVVPIIKDNLGYEFDTLLATLNKSESDMSRLTLDMDFDLYNIPLETSVIISPYTDDFTWDKVAQISLELDTLMKTNNITINKYSVILRHKPQDNEKNYDSMGVWDFPQELLAMENLPQVMENFSQSKEMEKCKDKE